MRIVSLHVGCFGKLKNFDLKFGSGLNVMQQQNGFGKTTLANFIRAMLYGFRYTRTKRGEESVSDVSLWANWDSNEKTGGSMVVEHNGDLFRIERYFGGTAKAEALKITNEKTGKALPVSDVGEYFLGLTAESYDRSCYFPQEAVELHSNGNLETRLAGLVQNAENYDKVQENLRKYRKDLKYERGNGGEIFDLEEKKIALERQIQNCTLAEQRQREIGRRLQEIGAVRQSLQSEAERLSGEIAQAQRKAALSADTAEQRESRQKLQQLEEKLQRMGDVEQDKALCDRLVQKIDSTPDLAKKSRAVSKPMLVAGSLLAAAGAGLCFVQIVVGIVAIVIGLALGVAAFFVKHSVTTLPAGEKDVYITQLFQIVGKYVYTNDMPYTKLSQAMWQVYNDYTGDKRVYEALQKTLASAGKTDGQWETKLLQAQAALEQNRQKQEALSVETGSLTEERKRLNTDSLAERQLLCETEERLADAKHRYAVAVKTSELLSQAKENLSSSYLPKLCQRCCELLNGVTLGNYQMVLNKDFGVRLRQNNITKPLDDFSRGTREITLLCFRVALAEMLFDGNIPFVLIDDAFVNFDEENFLRATQLLQQLSKNTQVVYFTCHNRLGNLQ